MRINLLVQQIIMIWRVVEAALTRKLAISWKEEKTVLKMVLDFYCIRLEELNGWNITWSLECQNCMILWFYTIQHGCILPVTFITISYLNLTTHHKALVIVSEEIQDLLRIWNELNECKFIHFLWTSEGNKCWKIHPDLYMSQIHSNFKEGIRVVIS